MNAQLFYVFVFDFIPVHRCIPSSVYTNMRMLRWVLKVQIRIRFYCYDLRKCLSKLWHNDCIYSLAAWQNGQLCHH